MEVVAETAATAVTVAEAAAAAAVMAAAATAATAAVGRRQWRRLRLRRNDVRQEGQGGVIALVVVEGWFGTVWSWEDCT
jgi:hypothetical protein